MSFWVLFIAGVAAGAALALMFGTRPIGWISLLIVPISAFAYVDWWQAQHPENLRSTSGLDYLFIPPIPMAGAFVSYAVIFLVRAWLETRDF